MDIRSEEKERKRRNLESSWSSMIMEIEKTH